MKASCEQPHWRYSHWSVSILISPIVALHFTAFTSYTHSTHILSCLSNFFFFSKAKGKGLQKDEKLRYEDECKAQQEAAAEKPWTLPYDAQLNNLIKETFKSVLPLHEGVEMYTALAKWVLKIPNRGIEKSSCVWNVIFVSSLIKTECAMCDKYSS